MLDIPDAHPGMPEAYRLLLKAYRQKRSGDLRRDTLVAGMTAIRKAATATVGWVAGLALDEVRLDPDDHWLLVPCVGEAERRTPWYFSCCCSALVGVMLAQDVAVDNGGDDDLCDGEACVFTQLKDLVGGDIDMDNLRAYARRLADWVRDEEGFRELTEVLIEKRYMDGQDVENLLTRNRLSAGSLRFHHRSSPHVEIGLEAAMCLPANDPSLAVSVSKAQRDFDDAPLQPLGVPIRC
jgi:hypothetical protein